LETWRGKNLEVKVLYSNPGIAQHIWIEHDLGALLLDVGDGILRDMRSHKLDPKFLKGIIVTHGHFDHVGGLHSLLGYLRMIGREADLSIYIPEGSPEVPGIVENFISIYGGTTPYRISILELGPHQSFEISGISVEAYPVVHCGSVAGHEVLDRIPAMGYRISFAGETVAVTGDTGMCPSLVELVKDSDLALIEATFGEARGVSQMELERVHLSEKAARELGKLARDFILVHRGGGNQ